MIKQSPDHAAIKSKVVRKIKGFKESRPVDEPEVELVKQYIAEAFNEFDEILNNCGLHPLDRNKLRLIIEEDFITESVKSSDVSSDDFAEEDEFEED